MKPKDVDLHLIFRYSEIESPYLENLVKRVIARIDDRVDWEVVDLGVLGEGTISGEAGEVTEDGDVNFSPGRLLRYDDDDVAMAIAAHELAHRILSHHERPSQGVTNDDAADALAEEWGFDIDKMRQVYGSAAE